MKGIRYFIVIIFSMAVLASCEDFFLVDQELELRESDVPADQVELRSVSLGLYSIQQELIEQIVILGELRGDLLEITKNANPDLREIYNFQVSPDNPYASSKNFYKLIAASNKMIRLLENKYLSNLDSLQGVTDYHRMLGEAICMRSWAYFNAARIYDEIPYIPETLTDMDRIIEYVNTPGTFVDSSFINYGPEGFKNDTVVMVYEPEDRMFLDQEVITRICIEEIENRVIDVGVDYGREYNDETWMVTIWNKYAMHALLGQMYLHIGDYTQAIENLNVMLNFVEPGAGSIRFGLDERFSNSSWRNILTNIDDNEHIFTLWFGKTPRTFQRNPLQYYFSSSVPNIYALKPTKKAVELWETVWRQSQIVLNDNQPEKSYTIEPGIPGDFFRGNGVSFAYIKDGQVLSDSLWAEMMDLKLLSKENELIDFMEGVDTVVYKYSIGKTSFSHDANFMVYRAAAIHLYAAEIYTNWRFLSGGIERRYLSRAEEYIYNGRYRNNFRQRGVAGRVGLNNKNGVTVGSDIIYAFDPYRNTVTGYKTISTTLEKTLHLEEIILEQKAREMAFEGERYYDLLRFARRRNERGLDGTGFLADKISDKFQDTEKEIIKDRLMDESNWYLPFKLN